MCTCVLMWVVNEKDGDVEVWRERNAERKKNKNKNKNSAEERQGERREEDMLLRREGIKEPSKWSQRIRR